MTGAEKTTLLFQYIKELGALKAKIAKNIKSQYWHKMLSDIPNHEQYISYTPEEDILLTVKKPDMQGCPPTEECFADWLETGWDKFKNDVYIIEKKLVEKAFGEDESIDDEDDGDFDDIDEAGEMEEPEDEFIYFTDDTLRVASFEAWKVQRDAWAEEHRTRYVVLQLFKDLHRLHMMLERDAETLEFVMGNGLLTDKRDPEMRYPVVTKRVELIFHNAKNVISIQHTDKESHLDTILLTGMDDIHYEAIQSLAEKHLAQGHHPFDGEHMPEELKSIAYSISPDSKYMEQGKEAEQTSERIVLANCPLFLVRKRMDGTQKAVEAIIENIAQTEYVPPHLLEIVEGGLRDAEEDEAEEPTLEGKLAAIGGEDIDILLSKEANKEQLEIAQKISKYNAVLVQGPPGTGKTHTISNLLGHFLAEGKSVLVTSHTKKALAVLKEKVTPDMQDLCVALLDDSNADMERSIDGITDMLSKHTVQTLKNNIENAAEERLEVIQQLAKTRRKIHQIKFAEFSPSAYCGESVSPTEMAKFVRDNGAELSYIPGKVMLNTPLPLSQEELRELYQSNGNLSVEEESVLTHGIPNPETILSPVDFSDSMQRLRGWRGNLAEVLHESSATVEYLPDAAVCFRFPHGQLVCSTADYDAITALKEWLQKLPSSDPWVIRGLTDGKKGEGHLRIWERLCTSVQELFQNTESAVELLFGKTVTISDALSTDILAEQLSKMQSIYREKGKIGGLDRLLNKQFAVVEQAISVNGAPPKTELACTVALKALELRQQREQCALQWNPLISVGSLPRFEDLHLTEPEQVAIKLLPEIQRVLHWYEQEYPKLLHLLDGVGIDYNILLPSNPLSTEEESVENTLRICKSTLVSGMSAAEWIALVATEEKHLSDLYEEQFLKVGGDSDVCAAVFEAYQKRDSDVYQTAYYALQTLYQKRDIQHKRGRYLEKLYAVAPDWANAMMQRVGIHGETIVPSEIALAWRWKQFAGMLDELTAEPYEALQTQSVTLSREYRNKTAQLAKWRAWLQLKQKIEKDLDMKMALMGWKLTMKKIGKGTGKLVPMLRVQARNQMATCQRAVPAWIMPISKALEDFTPGVNSFDVVIVDEASQSDIGALAITYMAKKVIVVGDDRQVSPLSVGLDITKMNQLAMGTIKDVIPNWHLYTGNASIYDIVSTVYTPLMLKEHFRCVPEIIGYSNQLSYDYKIKPLRDTSNVTIKPAVVNYRTDGERLGRQKINIGEAETIVALIRGCMAIPEYNGKTFGVISLLGEEQARKIEELIFDQLDTEEIEGRRILCGTSAQFQGDERDVVFLSLVDSNEKDGPLFMASEGSDDSRKKRYNVAASRAKDQLWVVHSLDIGKDLKSGDIRKNLLEYSMNPNAYLQLAEQVEKQSDSPFEMEVGKSLVAHGYQLVQQWEVGGYRIDMVVLDGEKKMAIECDGERWHSGEKKLREDMERQTILERLGWRFIRIRGSAYYRNPEETMESVYATLEANEIMPNQSAVTPLTETHELLERVKEKASEFLRESAEDDIVSNQLNTIAFALDPTTDEPLPCAEEKLEVILEANTGATTENPVESTENPQECIAGDAVSEETEVAVQLALDVTGAVFAPSQEDVITILETSNVFYVDKRKNGGALWVIGGKEVMPVIERCRQAGIKFAYKTGGGKATKGKDGWWAK